MNAQPSEDLLWLRVLLLDDCGFDRSRLRRMLNRIQILCEVDEASGLAELDSKLEQRTNDVFFFDYDLLEGTGFDAICRAKACPRNSNALFVLVTGNTAPSLTKDAMAHGFFNCIKKAELTPAGLLNTLEKGLQSRWRIESENARHSSFSGFSYGENRLKAAHETSETTAQLFKLF